LIDENDLGEAASVLSRVQDMQRRVDAIAWTSATDHDAKRRHVLFHLAIAAGKVARVEERADHGDRDDSVLDDVAADLLIYATQLASIRGADLGDLYRRRVQAALRGQIQHDTP
jgi:hypothetical protein